MSYTRSYTLDPSPTGDTVKVAVVDKIDPDLTAAVGFINTHEALTATHGATGAVVGTTNIQTLTNKTINGATLSGTVTCTNASLVGVTIAGLNNATLTGVTTISSAVGTIGGMVLSGTITGGTLNATTMSGTTTAATLVATTINGLTETAATTGYSIAGGFNSCTLTVDADFTVSSVTAGMPSGAVTAYGGATSPSGWLECNGASLLRANYTGLFSAIGTNHGYADSTHFYLPDLRGYFVRGWDHGALNDADSSTRTAGGTNGSVGDLPGTKESPAISSHLHAVSITSGTESANHAHSVTGTTGTESASHHHTLSSGTTGEGNSEIVGMGQTQAYNPSTANESATHTHSFTASVGTESSNHSHAVSGSTASTGNAANDTRPKNIALMYIIKT